jgi:surface antigen
MRLWQRGKVGQLAVATALAAALAGGGCSYRLDSLFGSESGKADRTGSVATTAAGKTGAEGKLPPEQDLAYARAAASEVLTRGGKDASLPWENPQTGARGTVTPIAAAYTQDGFTCRDFRASYVRGGAEAWMQGEACRQHRGKWEVRSLKPLQQP